MLRVCTLLYAVDVVVEQREDSISSFLVRERAAFSLSPMKIDSRLLSLQAGSETEENVSSALRPSLDVLILSS